MLDALNQYIPMQAGQSFLLKAQTDLVNNLLGYIGYEVKDGYIVFTEDIIATQMVTSVDLQLVVMDASKYGDYDNLPIPADMAGKLVIDCFNILKQQLPNDNVVSAVSEEPLQNKR